MMDVQATSETFTPQKRRASSTSKHKISLLFSIFMGHHCPPRSGSHQNQCESGFTNAKFLKEIFCYTSLHDNWETEQSTKSRYLHHISEKGLKRGLAGILKVTDIVVCVQMVQTWGLGSWRRWLGSDGWVIDCRKRLIWSGKKVNLLNAALFKVFTQSCYWPNWIQSRPDPDPQHCF